MANYSPESMPHEQKTGTEKYTVVEAYQKITDMIVRCEDTIEAVVEVLLSTDPTTFTEVVGLELAPLTEKIDSEISEYLMEGKQPKSLNTAGEVEVAQLRIFYNINSFIAFGQSIVGQDGVIGAESYDQFLRYRVVIKRLEDISGMYTIPGSIPRATDYGHERRGTIDPSTFNDFSPDYQNDIKALRIPHIRGIGGVL